MSNNESEIDSLVRQASAGDRHALDQLFHHYRDRLKKMIRMRLNSYLQGRIDDSDVLQDAYLEAAKRLEEYLQDPQAPFFLWLRQITSQKLIDVHRRHLGAQARDARVEISLYRGRLPMASSISLAAHLLGRLSTPSQVAVKAETRLALQQALLQMDEIDREILSLRHFEHLSNQEAAIELGIEASAASKRYLRALQRLQTILTELGLVE